MVCNGVVGCRLKNGSLDNIILDSHKALQLNDALAKQAPQRKWVLGVGGQGRGAGWAWVCVGGWVCACVWGRG